MTVVNDITNNMKTDKKAALYYKTEALHVNVDNYVHTNNWEILQSIKILNSKGFSVDLIDRSCRHWSPKQTYDLFLGLGVGNSGRNFVAHAQASKAPKKVLLSMGPQPDISNDRTHKRYKMFHERTGHYAPPMRTVGEVTGDNFLKIIDTADYVFNIGEKNTQSYNSFLKYGKPVINFYPSISPFVNYHSQYLSTRDMNSFLCFAGNGFICKGVDLVVEAFLRDPSKQLHICGPKSEASFFQYYGQKIAQSPNIHYHGFITPGGERFNALASICSYVVFHSAAEGCCTSVATAIKAGLVPIINKWTGINIKDEGVGLSEEGDLIENISRATSDASAFSNQHYTNMVEKIVDKSQIFSQASFTDSYSKAIDIITSETLP